MRYKGEYSPSYLLDPVRIESPARYMKPSLKTCCRVQGTNAWYPLDSVRDLLDANPTGYKAFDSTVLTSQNDGSSKSGGRRGAVEASRRGADAWPRPPPPGFKDPQLVSKDVLRNLVVFLDGQLTLLKVSRLIEEMIGQHRLNVSACRRFPSAALPRVSKWRLN